MGTFQSVPKTFKLVLGTTQSVLEKCSWKVPKKCYLNTSECSDWGLFGKHFSLFQNISDMFGQTFQISTGTLEHFEKFKTFHNVLSD